jgi:hypothetical protein
MYTKTKVRRSRKDVAEKLLDQLDILKYNNWPLEIYDKYRDIIEQLDPHKEDKPTRGRTRLTKPLKRRCSPITQAQP